jgi:hypothetical protein
MTLVWPLYQSSLLLQVAVYWWKERSDFDPLTSTSRWVAPLLLDLREALGVAPPLPEGYRKLLVGAPDPPRGSPPTSWPAEWALPLRIYIVGLWLGCQLLTRSDSIWLENKWIGYEFNFFNSNPVRSCIYEC